MGAIADAIAAYAQPLLEQCDGSEEGLQRAFAMSTLCYNLALFAADTRDQAIREMQASLKMGDEEFGEFRRAIIDPMIDRHRRMFPLMHQRLAPAGTQSGLSARTRQSMAAAEPARTATVADRYAPCPCNSGEKFKFCCGKNKR